MPVTIRPLSDDDLPRLREHWRKHWSDEFVVSRGVIHRPDSIDGGFVALIGDEWVGEVTFRVMDDACEIVSLDSQREGQGIGTQLVDAVVEEAQSRNCKRVWLITTNDNLHAFGFYQKRGFELVTVHRGAVNESRKLKPAIPAIGMNNIPLRDEIELEMNLQGRVPPALIIG